MTLYNFEAIKPAPSRSETLKVISDAIGPHTVPSTQRVAAAVSSRSPEEGLALLTAYIAIEDRDVRQAILDAVLAISGRDDAGR